MTGYIEEGSTPLRNTSPRRCLFDTISILRTKDISTTILRTAMARLRGLIIHLIAVIVREFLTCLDISNRHNPDGFAELFRVAVWVTRVIGIACRVLGRTPINGVPLIQAKDIDIAYG